jgi:hypothetical protein
MRWSSESVEAGSAREAAPRATQDSDGRAIDLVAAGGAAAAAAGGAAGAEEHAVPPTATATSTPAHDPDRMPTPLWSLPVQTPARILAFTGYLAGPGFPNTTRSGSPVGPAIRAGRRP